MIQMTMATTGNSPAVRVAHRRRTFTVRQVAGFTIVASGLAVMVAHALQPVLGG
jgi:hypothetical protein